MLELGSLVAGPFVGKTLADFGAEVVKIEPPGEGDPLRKWRRMRNGTSLWWQVQSRGKKSVTCDLRKPEGQAVVRRLGMPPPRTLTGAEIHAMSDEALRASVADVQLFAEVEPSQKERILLAYRKAGHVVGFLGDGINDAPALHAADVGLSVDGAADVAREAADLVLLDAQLRIEEVYARGRRMVEGGQPVVRGWFEGKNHARPPRG